MKRDVEMQAKVEALNQRAQRVPAGNGGDADADHEEELLLPQDAEGQHPLRLIEFPRDFHERFREFPHHVSRAAMVMLGRLAGGDSAAFSGAKRLKSRPNIVRQRIGIDFRLAVSITARPHSGDRPDPSPGFGTKDQDLVSGINFSLL